MIETQEKKQHKHQMITKTIITEIGKQGWRIDITKTCH